MESIFNELSFIPLSENPQAADIKVENLLIVLKQLNTFGFKHLRVRQDFMVQELCEKFTISDWLSFTKNITYKSALLSVQRHPYIEDSDENAIEKYVESSYLMHCPQYSELDKIEVEGLAAAFINETCSISFSSHGLWNSPQLIIQNKETTGLHEIVNVSSPESIKENIKWFEIHQEVVLISCQLDPSNKKIALRDDHGKDQLQKFGEKLLLNEYVVGVVNSLPFNPKQKSFVRRCRENGLVEIVLHRTDQGLGLIVQTTGRNISETEQIAKILEKKYYS